MKHNDSKYHVVHILHSYMGGYQEYGYSIENVYGELCKEDGRTLVYLTEGTAQSACDKLNQCSDGGVMTNLT